MGTISQPAPWQEAEIDDFRGPWSRVDSTQVPPTEALYSRNSYYDPGSVGTRFGFAQFGTVASLPSNVLNTLFNWLKEPDAIATNGNYIVGGGGLFATSGLGTLLATVAYGNAGTSSATGGSYLFTAGYNVDGTGASFPNVTQIIGAAAVSDLAFMGPTTPSAHSLSQAADANSFVTPGLHNVGFIMVSRSGFVGPWQSIGSITVTSGNNIGVSITITPPADCAYIQWCMTAVVNPYQWFALPIPQVAVTPSSSQTITLTIEIADQNLIQNGTDVTANSLLVVRNGTGSTLAPANVFKLLQYGPRMCYFFVDPTGIPTIAVSNTGAYQQVTYDQNTLTLPGFLTITTGFVLRGVLYICGSSWTYAFQDTGDVPAVWSSAVLIDQRFGTPCIEGTTANASGGWAAVVHHTGLYIFNGQYAQLPLSYMVDDQWQRINWLAPETIRIVDNQDRKQLLLAVPLTTNSVVNVTSGGTPVVGTPTLVVHAMASGLNTGTTPARNTTGANLIVLNCGSSGPISLNPTDSLGNVWIPLGAYSFEGQFNQLFYCINPTVGAGHTFTLTAISTPDAAPIIGMQAWANTSGGWAVQGGNVNNIVPTTAGTVTPNENGTLIIAAFSGIFPTETPSINSGFTISDYLNASDGNAAMAYLVQATAATVSPQWNVSGGAALVVSSMAVFRPTVTGLSTMTLVSGDQFNSGWAYVPITLNGHPYTIVSVNTAGTVAMVLGSPPGGINQTMTCISPIPTHLFMFDYTDGLDYTTVKFSIWDISQFGPSGLTVFLNPNTNALEYLISQYSMASTALNLNLYRQQNPTDDPVTCYQDTGSVSQQAIQWRYEIAPQPGGSVGTVWAHPGGYVRAKGTGTLSATSYGLDHEPVAPWVKKIPLQVYPAQEYWRQFYMTSERCSVQFSTGVNVGDYCVITGYKHMYYPYASRR